MNGAVVLLVGAGIFAAGLLTGRATVAVVPDATGHDLTTSGKSTTNSAERDQTLEMLGLLHTVADRLESLQAANSGLAPARSEDSRGLTPDVIAELKSQIATMATDLHLQTASLEEVGHLKPSPDLVALDRLWRDTKGDATAIVLRVSGMTFHDATVAFGTPTLKRPVKNSANKVLEWLWDMPDQGRVFVFQFEGGIAAGWGGFASRDYLKDQ